MIKIRRFIAAYIDFWLCFIPGYFISLILQPKPYIFIDLINVIFVLLPFIVSITLWVYKDTILKNRSIGKKIMGLYIYDSNHYIVQNKEILIQRIFYELWLFPVSCFLILICNQSIGDQKYKTIVGPKIIWK